MTELSEIGSAKRWGKRQKDITAYGAHTRSSTSSIQLTHTFNGS